ncbi:DgyrCDS14322 [Dimorphilus gyrociliatus]|uniref:Guanylate cyclase n=1 Tax=Dimorphilus gyrociliatus TaxID=2664684 RepID=A0A7I8WDH3_9ANNE|nr:DgyrCDS14322 [Dimorphilus gyrociliatus]
MTSAAAVDIAIQTINSNPKWNADGEIELSMVYRDSDCDSLLTVGHTCDLLVNETIDALIGPPCSRACKPAAELASFYNVPIISWVATDYGLRDRTRYTTLARTSIRIAAVMFEGLVWEDAGESITKVLKDRNIELVVLEKYKNDPSKTFINSVLEKIRVRARIVALINPREHRRKFLLRAHEKGMTNGDYVFYTMDILPQEDILNSMQTWQGNDGRDSTAKQAFESVFHIVLAAPSSVAQSQFRGEVARRMRFPPWNVNLPPGTLGDPFAAFLHDAVLIYSIGLNVTLKLGQNPRNGEAVISNLKEKFFQGMSGNIVLDGNADREPDFWIMDMNPATGIFEKMAEVLNTDDGHMEFRRDIQPPYWPNGLTGHENAPEDIPKCGFLNELCVEADNSWISIVASLIALISIGGLLGVGFYFYRKSQFENRLLAASWKISLEELELLKTQGTSSNISLSSKSTTSNSNEEPAPPVKTETVSKSINSFGQVSQVFTEISLYKGTLASLKPVKKDHVELSRKVLIEFGEIRDISHENLNTFLGACVSPQNIYVLWQYCKRGSIQDVVMNDDLKLESNFKMSFMIDIVKGMLYLHKSILHSNGNLKSSNCLVNERWTVKITDYGLNNFLDGQIYEDSQQYELYKRKLWTAPEILRENYPPLKGSQKGDVYSFAIICSEILNRSEPYSFNEMTPRDVVHRIRNSESIPFRPKLPENCEFGYKMIELIHNMWHDIPEERPTFSSIRGSLLRLNRGEYAKNLETTVQERTEQISEEKAKSDPGTKIEPESYRESSIYFSDIVGFTTLSSDSTPMQIVDFLNDLYTCFDGVVSDHDVYKVETIGDAYMVVSGVPNRNGRKHLTEIADISLDLLSSVTNFCIRHRPKEQLRLRIGLHTGPVVAGVIGNVMPRYCLFGDTVNLASKMESCGKPLRIHLSEDIFKCLTEFGLYSMIKRGNINIKGKGFLTTYWLYGKQGYDKPLPDFD